MRATRITDNGFEITNVRATMKNSIWMNLKDKTKQVLQKMGVLAKPNYTGHVKRK